MVNNHLHFRFRLCSTKALRGSLLIHVGIITQRVAFSSQEKVSYMVIRVNKSVSFLLTGKHKQYVELTRAGICSCSSQVRNILPRTAELISSILYSLGRACYFIMGEDSISMVCLALGPRICIRQLILMETTSSGLGDMLMAINSSQDSAQYRVGQKLICSSQ